MSEANTSWAGFKERSLELDFRKFLEDEAFENQRRRSAGGFLLNLVVMVPLWFAYWHTPGFAGYLALNTIALTLLLAMVVLYRVPGIRSVYFSVRLSFVLAHGVIWTVSPLLFLQDEPLSLLSLFFMVTVALFMSHFRSPVGFSLVVIETLVWQISLVLSPTIATQAKVVISPVAWTSILFMVYVAYLVEQVRRTAFVQSRQIERQKDELARSEAKAMGLLLNIVPPTIAERLGAGEVRIADSHPQATVVFADIAGFTSLSEYLEAKAVVDVLDQLFSTIDKDVQNLGLEKIKTIGDCYMAVAGIPNGEDDQADRAVELGLRILDQVERFNARTGRKIAMRVGIHTGPVVAGVIGSHKYTYDLWGDTVNTASRMETHGIEGKVLLTESTRRALKGRYELVDNGPQKLKEKGEVQTWTLVRPFSHEI